MTTIRLTTWVNAPVERCFLLATNTELFSVVQTQAETRASGQGTLQQGDVLSWQMRAGGARLSYVSRIEAMRPFSYIREVLVAGVFRHFEHDHHFARMDDGTRMRDEVRFTLRYGILGRVFGFTIVRAALIKTLSRRTAELKRIAESGEWERYVEPKDLLGGALKVTEPSARVTNLQRFA